jgi:plasmid replication initiation protein
MKEKFPVIQPNPITAARYDFNLVEKRIMYHIIIDMQSHYTEGKEFQETLFKDLVIKLPIAKLHDTVSKNYKEVRKAAESMIGKKFSIDQPDGGWLIVGLVTYAQYYPKTQILELEVSRKLLPYLFEFAKGFTAYYATVAMSLKSIYSQRFYEFCNRFKDTGKWYITVQELKEILTVENQYELYGDFKKRVLEIAKKELKESADSGFSDVWFDYKEKKQGRKVQDLVFTIYWKDKQERKPQTSEEMQYVANLLKSIFPEEKQKPFVTKTLSELHRKNQLGLIGKRLQDLEDQALAERKPLSAYGGLIRHILEQDYKIK